MIMYAKKAKQISFSKRTRSRADIIFIVIHYTSNVGDSAKNNVVYFAKGNTEEAGAHFFVDQNGYIGKSIPLNRTAWAVGGNNLGGSLYGIVTNENSVSIELCDLVNKEPSTAMIKAVKEVIKYIQECCPNANTIVRHYDVTGKLCPATLVDNAKWSKFLKSIGWALVGKRVAI